MDNSSWRAILRQNFTDWKKLFAFLELDEQLSCQLDVKTSFPLNLPRRLAEKIQKGTLDDPILRQFLPVIEETVSKKGFCLDPVGEAAVRKSPKLLHKYHGRALLTCTSACAMHCRFCFRRHFGYDTHDKLFAEELADIREDASISEVILSGGDPLSLGNELLEQLVYKLANISHVKRLRFHTRFPVGIPERIDEGFLKLLSDTHLQVIFIIHSNHPLELDDEVLSSLKKIQKLGIPVLHQGVLLKGVNDDAATLKELFEKLGNHGIIAYYLHQLDKVQGAAHFEVAEETGLQLIKEITSQLSGYAVPRYVREDAGASSKTLIEKKTNP